MENLDIWQTRLDADHALNRKLLFDEMSTERTGQKCWTTHHVLRVGKIMFHRKEPVEFFTVEYGSGFTTSLSVDFVHFEIGEALKACRSSEEYWLNASRKLCKEMEQ